MRLILDEVEIDGVLYRARTILHPDPLWAMKGRMLLALDKIGEVEKTKVGLQEAAANLLGCLGWEIPDKGTQIPKVSKMETGDDLRHPNTGDKHEEALTLMDFVGDR